MSTEPILPPTRESLEQGAEPADALSPHSTSEIAEAPAPEDELDVAYGAAEARAALAEPHPELYSFEAAGNGEYPALCNDESCEPCEASAAGWEAEAGL